MPLYEYLCKDCGARFDSFRPMKEADAPITCKNCLGKLTQRALSRVNPSNRSRSTGSTSGSGGGCGGCSGGSCSSCHH